MEIMKRSKIHPLSFRHKFGGRFHHMVNRDFLMGRDPLNDYPITDDDIHAPTTNVRQTQDHYELEIPVPGYKESEIDISVEENVLTVKGKREVDLGKHKDYIIREHDMDQFERSYGLSSVTDQDNIDASLRNGMLYITLHHIKERKKEDNARSIPIK